jgi:hypothetical protein
MLYDILSAPDRNCAITDTAAERPSNTDLPRAAYNNAPFEQATFSNGFRPVSADETNVRRIEGTQL